MFLSTLFSFTSTIGFSIILNIPRKFIIDAGFIGSLAWLISESSKLVFKDTFFIPNFFAAFIIGISSYFLQFKKGAPTTLIQSSSILSFVPGGIALTAVKSIKNGQVNIAAESILNTLTIVAALSFGLAVSKYCREELAYYKKI